jgi:hypothetical protein
MAETKPQDRIAMYILDLMRTSRELVTSGNAYAGYMLQAAAVLCDHAIKALKDKP